ncbi:MAG TPA: OsmC family protein [Gemmatimonadales bacterium]|nr:OsmC family protein [Gemmatimonadales bacterium]
MAGEAKQVELTWEGGQSFRGGVPGRPTALVDGDGAAAPSPVDQLLIAAASCTGIDVVLILEKMRATIASFRIEVAGERRTEAPRRFLAIHFRFLISGEGIDETKLRRAVDLSLEKYCSVVHSLAPDIRITYDAVVG